MKNIILSSILLTFFLCGCYPEDNQIYVEQVFFPCYDSLKFGALRPNQINGLPPTCVPEVVVESYDTVPKQWSIGNTTKYSFSIADGYYTMQSNENANWYSTASYAALASVEHYEVESLMKITKSNTVNSYAALSWSCSDDLKNRMEIGFTNDGRYFIRAIVNNVSQTPIVNFKTSVALKKSDFNKITIRYFRGIHYFFINDVLVESFKTISVSEKGIALGTSALSAIKTDWIKLRWINL